MLLLTKKINKRILIDDKLLSAKVYCKCCIMYMTPANFGAFGAFDVFDEHEK